ncbi:MAG: transketolase [Alphaproteobacteria bacterium]|nr:transketolase [Alphaproteobacteria bacterium]MDE2341499.1 transketolase [Alphaproteobacteria bacterium]
MPDELSFDDRIAHVRARALWVRRRAFRMVYEARQGHPGGDMSATDILAALYFDVMRYDPANPRDPGRDRFIMSKGHCTGALYSTLAAAGFFPEEELCSYMQPLSRLNGHPNCTKLPGVETNTGPLGHGVPVAVGLAIAGQIDKADYRVFVLTGDGELQEGSIWEAAMTAGHRKLANLTLIVDRNTLQQGARTEETVGLEPLADKWRAFGWDVAECDGHDLAALLPLLDRSAPRERPRAIIARTVKGKGVSFMEDQASWHHGVPNTAQFEQAMRELVA